MKLAEQFEMDEKYDEAYVEYKKELVNKSGNVDIYTKLAHLALILNKKEDAKIYYAKILELDSANILAHEQLIDIYENEDKYKYYLLRGNLHSIQQQYSHARNDYKKAIDVAKDQKEALPARYLYAGLCEEQGKIQTAIDEYLKISDYDDSNPSVYLKLAELYEKTEGIEASIEILERAIKDNNYTQFNEVLAKYYIRNSQPEKALQVTRDELVKARALMDSGKNDDAFDILNSIKSKYKNNSQIYSLFAQYYFQKGMYDDAFREIDEFAKIDSKSPLIYQMRALIYEKIGDSYNEHINWGKYNIIKGERDVALNEYMTAYQFNGNDADLIETIAVQLELAKDKTKACEFYERLLDVDSKNTNALQKLAEFRNSIGDYAGANDYIEKLKLIDPRNSFVAENYEKYKNRAEEGGDLLRIFKSIFGRRMG